MKGWSQTRLVQVTSRGQRRDLRANSGPSRGWWCATDPDRRGWHVCHETIYQALYLGEGVLNRQLTRRLRPGRLLRKRRRHPGVALDHRPAAANERSRLSDWKVVYSAGQATSPPSPPYRSGVKANLDAARFG